MSAARPMPWLAEPPACPASGSGSQQDGASLAGRVLQGGAHLACVQRIDAGVVAEDREQHGRILHALAAPGGTASRTAGSPAARGLDADPNSGTQRSPEPGQLIADHVEQRRRAHRGREQVRPLGERRADQQAAVRLTAERTAAPASSSRSAISVSAAAMKSSKTFCFCVQHAGLVPVVAPLAATPQGGSDEDAAGLDPGEREGGVRRGERLPETAVPVEDRGPRSGHARLGDDEQLRSRCRPARCRRAAATRHPQYRSRRVADDQSVVLAGGRVVPVDGCGSDAVGVAEPGLVSALRPGGQRADRADAGQRDLAEVRAGAQVVDRRSRRPRSWSGRRGRPCRGSPEPLSGASGSAGT